MKKFITWLGVIGLFGVLVAIRAYEDTLFYDPLIPFFKLDHSTQSLPEMEHFRLVANIALRFWMNTLISLGILWLLFRKKEIIKMSVILFSIVFVVLLLAFVILLSSSPTASGASENQLASGGHLALFYVRRFLIQPVFLLLLIPAFYFQKRS
jgi:exosortase F-associated protein